jgi:hypothetical protein
LSRLAVVVDRECGVEAAELARAWNEDAETRQWGLAETEISEAGVFFPGPVELVVIPLAVNLASSVVYDVVRRVVTRLRDRHGATAEELEIIEHEVGSGRVVVVRVRRGLR